MSAPADDSSSSSKEKGKGENEEYYGFDHYPDRRSFTPYTSIQFWLGGRGNIQRIKRKCEMNVLKAMKEHPLVRILVNALDNAGCHVDISRHISCEECSDKVTGGYDTELNQVVICENSLKARYSPEITLTHELIHMYDYCVNEVDFRNIDHLACSEIRAANLSHCSFLSSVFLKQSSFFNIQNTHQYCVKMKATQSLMVARNLDFDTALKHVLKVFDKCYHDLEPIGRRVRRNSSDPYLAYKDSVHFGYSKPTAEAQT